MKLPHRFNRFVCLVILALFLAGCTGSTAPTAGEQSTAPTTAGTSAPREETHGEDAEPDYAVVFPQDSVNRMDITLSPEAWAALQAEMTELFGAPGQQQGFGNPGQMPGGQDQARPQPPGFQGTMQPPDFQGNQPPPGNIQPGGFPGNGMGNLDFADTSYVKATVTFDGLTWESVGFRYSGNSTLQN